jgi:hypothetical protein
MRTRTIGVSALAVAVSAVAAQGAAASGPPAGHYRCYQTFREVSQINGEVTYATQYRDTLILRRHRRYEQSLRVGPGRYRYKSGRLAFHGGSLDSASQYWHVAGRYRRAGRTMPHSVLKPTKRYKIVLRDRRSDDSDTAPPVREFDARQNASFWYCSR